MAIGDVRVASTTINPIQVRSSPADFGAGIGQALGGIGAALSAFDVAGEGTLKQQALFDRTIQQRADKTSKAEIDTQLVAFNAETEKILAQHRIDSDTSTGQDYTKEVNELVEKRYNEFAKTIPKHLQEGYSVRLQQSKSAADLKAFNFNATEQTKRYGQSVEKMVLEMSNSILSGASTPIEWKEQLDELRKNSVLTAADTAALFSKIDNRLITSQYTFEVGEAAKHSNLTEGIVPGSKPDGTDIVAAGLPGVSRGFLNTLAKVEVTGGKYNVIQGGTTFKSFDKHPGIKVSESTAAGRYQFIKSTWDRVAKKMGFTDFSPENQDRGAWFLAQEDYARRTGGGDLQSALQSGNFQLIAQVRRILAGSGSGKNAKNVTWEGLQHISDREFFRRVTSSDGSPVSFVSDERFASIPHADRVKIARQAEGNAARQRASSMAIRDAERTQILSDTLIGITNGNINPVQAGAIADAQSFDFTDLTKIERALESKFAQERGAANNVALQANPTGFNGNKEQKDNVTNYYNEGLRKGIQEQSDEAAVLLQQGLQAIPYISPQASEDLSQMMLSRDQGAQRFALQTMSNLYDTNQRVFGTTFDESTTNALHMFRSGALTADELNQWIRDENNPNLAQVRKNRTDAIAILRKDDAESFLGVGVASDLGFSVDNTDGGSINALESEFNRRFEYFFSRLGDAGKAREAAYARLKETWGNTNIGSETRMMKYPIEKSGHQPHRGSFEYINTQLRSEFGLDLDTKFRLVPEPGVTDSAISRGVLPTYSVMIQDPKTGAWEMQLEEVNGAFTGKPVQWKPEINAAMTIQSIIDVVQKQKVTSITNSKHQVDEDVHVIREQLQRAQRTNIFTPTIESRQNVAYLEAELARLEFDKKTLDKEAEEVHSDISSNTLKQYEIEEEIRGLRGDLAMLGLRRFVFDEIKEKEEMIKVAEEELKRLQNL